MIRSLFFLVSVALCIFPIAAYADPHPHRGKLRPFSLREPGVLLDESILKQGLPFYTTTSLEEGGRAMIVQDIHAPSNIVWDRILDFDSYVDMVPHTVESSIYKRELLSHHGDDKVATPPRERISVRLKMGLPMLHKKLQFHVQHLHDGPRQMLTWNLDYDKASDIDDSVGYWFVIPHPQSPDEWTRVYHSVEMQMFAWVPKMVLNRLIKQEKVLADTMAWVKKAAEEAATFASVGKIGSKVDEGLQTTTTTRE